MEIIAKLINQVHAVGGLAKAAEYDFFKALQIAKAVARGNYLFKGNFAVIEPQIMAVIAVALVSYAKITTVGALIRQVQIQLSIERIRVGILAIFRLFLGLFVLFLLFLMRLLILFALIILLILKDINK